jgi:hypothetical protein
VTEDNSNTQRARRALERAIDKAGCTYKEIALAVGRDQAHLWRIHQNQDNRLASADLARRLEEFADREVRRRAAELLREMSLNIRVVGYCAGPDAPVTDADTAQARRAAQDTLVAALLGQQPPEWSPDAKPGLLVELNAGGQIAYLILADPRLGQDMPKAVCHEAHELIHTMERRMDQRTTDKPVWVRKFTQPVTK